MSSKTRCCPRPPPNPSPPSCPGRWAQVSSSQNRMLHNLLGRWRMLTQARIIFLLSRCEFYGGLEEPAGRMRGPQPIWLLLLFLMSYYPIINISISNEKATEIKQPRIFKFNHSQVMVIFIRPRQRAIIIHNNHLADDLWLWFMSRDGSFSFQSVSELTNNLFIYFQR